MSRDRPTSTERMEAERLAMAERDPLRPEGKPARPGLIAKATGLVKASGLSILLLAFAVGLVVVIGWLVFA